MSLLGSHHHKPPFLRTILIYMINLLLLVLSLQTVSFVSVDNVHVVLFLIPLFYWVVHQPSVMPLWFVFLAGLATDFALHSLLGLHAFGFTLFYIILYNARRVILSQPMLYHFITFGIGCLAFEMLRWCLASLLQWQALPFYPSLLGFALNLVAFFPTVLVLKVFHRLMSGGYGRSL